MPGLISVDLQRFFKTQPAPAKLWQGQDQKLYFQALQLYWAGKKTEALRLSSEALASDEDYSMRFGLYRLWIQVASDLGETLSLNGLRDHLLLVGQSDPENREALMALRGIIHLQLDQIEAAKLLSRGLEGQLTGFSDNPYTLEFLDTLDAQTKSDVRSKNSPSRLLDSTEPIRDWFHWQCISRSMLRHGHDEKNWVQVKTVSQHVGQVFPQSPIDAESDMHRCLENGRFADAFLYASKLSKMYPANSDYVFYKAFARLKCGEPRAALEVVDNCHIAGIDRDADFSLLRGSCLAEIAKRSGDVNVAADAKSALESAIKLGRHEGMPTLTATSLLAEISDIMRNDTNEPDHTQAFRPARIWFAKVSPQEFHELRSAPQLQIENMVRPMGDQPQPGDLCFFAGEGPNYNPNGNPGWRIAAVYSVTASPAWHPTVRYQSSLQLLSRPEFSIPVDMQVLDEDQSATRETPRNHPMRSGVFEVEMGALDVITEIIRARSEGSANSIVNHIDSMSGMRRSV